MKTMRKEKEYENNRPLVQNMGSCMCYNASSDPESTSAKETSTTTEINWEISRVESGEATIERGNVARPSGMVPIQCSPSILWSWIFGDQGETALSNALIGHDRKKQLSPSSGGNTSCCGKHPRNCVKRPASRGSRMARVCLDNCTVCKWLKIIETWNNGIFFARSYNI